MASPGASGAGGGGSGGKSPRASLSSHSEWLATTLACLGEAVISVDVDGRVNLLNEQGERLTGWTEREALGRDIDEVLRLVDEHSRERVDSSPMRALRLGAAAEPNTHTVLIGRDGTERIVEDRAEVVRSREGHILGCVGVIRDITERERADRALRQSEAALAEFFENANIGLKWIAPDGTIQRVNRAEAEMLGQEPGALVGMHLRDILIDEATIHQMLETLQGGESVHMLTTLVRRKDGTELHVLINASPLFEGGRFVHSRCFMLDMSARTKAHQVQAVLASIVETSDDAIVSKTLDGVIRSWNPGAERLFGYTAAEATGKSIDLIIPEELRGEEREILRRLSQGERIDHFETERIAKDGRRLNISLTVSPIKNAAGKIVGASKVGRDITERKRAEREREALLAAERRARSEAERANRLKEDFLATLSHELRTPLNAILGWVHILTSKPTTEEVRRQGMSVIERNARVQAQLIADLLDMSRISSGKMRLDVQQVDLTAVIEAAMDAVRPAADSKGVRLHSVVEPISGGVYGDPSRLQQVVWNLLSNAVKFTPRDGRVQVTLRRVHSHVELSVRDTGKGIPAEFLPNVFERFRQYDSSMAREYGGLGLGLAIVKQLVELHGGTVEAVSEGEGRGAMFTVRLPTAAVHMPQQAEPAPEAGANAAPSRSRDSADLTGVQVLVVDDEADARDLLQHVLEGAGARVLLAKNAADAIGQLRVQSPQVIVSDIGMPDRDGYSMMRELRERGVRTPAAALTAFARAEDRTRALEAGFQRHIAKPVDPNELLAVIASLASDSAVMARKGGEG